MRRFRSTLCLMYVLLLTSTVVISPSLFFYSEDTFAEKSSVVKTPSKTPIKHVIVISQGRRSFDNYFGTYPGAKGFPPYIQIETNPFPPSLERFTVSSWFSTSKNYVTDAFIVNKGGLGSEKHGQNMNYGIWINNKEKVSVGFESKEGTDFIINSTQSYADGKWHFVVFTYDGLSIRLYIDGSEIANRVLPSGTVPDPGDMQILRVGANAFKPNKFFTGRVSDLQILDWAIDPSEVKRRFNEATPYLVTSLPNGKAKEYFQLDGHNYNDINLKLTHYSKRLQPFHLMNTVTEMPDHSFSAYKTSFNNGFMDGFIYAQGQNLKLTNQSLVMGYYDNRDIPYYWNIASQGVLADNFFSPSMGSDLANQLYLYTGESTPYGKYVPRNGLTAVNQTIFDLLQEKGISWKIYVEDYNPALNYTNENIRKNLYYNPLLAIPRFVHTPKLNSHIVDLLQYYDDLRNGTLPAVSYIVAPNFDESAPNGITPGEQFVTSLIIALMKSTSWNQSAFILTYRESGGWYDHVPPPIAKTRLQKTFQKTYGFRVPTLVTSPYAKQGFIDSTFYDSTSILKFIGYNFLLPSYGFNNSNSIINMFDFSKPPRQPFSLDKLIHSEDLHNLPKATEQTGLVNLIYGIVFILIIFSTSVILWRLHNEPRVPHY